ncbi:MAG TPA: ABC transporter ATP-binding protein [Acidimicrobiales bacterium]|nr:ABC transporter ATP-binding protein [Acidimicrobiales bacterium]
MSVLALEALTKDYGDVRALDGISLAVDAGEHVALVGPNGSGKTTLVRLAAGLLDPTAGEILVLGHPAGTLAARAEVSFIPDTPALYDDLSVREHLEYVARLHGVEQWEDRADELLAALGLASRADALPSTFSRGLRQKTAIAVALVRPASLLLVDEPFVGLDAAGRHALRSLLADRAATGTAVVVATHQLDYAAAVPRCIVFRDGEVVGDGPLTDDDAGDLDD